MLLCNDGRIVFVPKLRHHGHLAQGVVSRCVVAGKQPGCNCWQRPEHLDKRIFWSSNMISWSISKSTKRFFNYSSDTPYIYISGEKERERIQWQQQYLYAYKSRLLSNLPLCLYPAVGVANGGKDYRQKKTLKKLVITKRSYWSHCISLDDA